MNKVSIVPQPISGRRRAAPEDPPAVHLAAHPGYWTINEPLTNRWHATAQQFALVASIACLVVLGQAAPAPEDPLAKPNPYAFSYSADSLGGRAAHSEQGDGTGRVQGFYTILGADGRERRVEYVADELGYRATIQTNEIGTKADSAANAEYIVSAPTDQQMAQANLFQQRSAASRAAL